MKHILNAPPALYRGADASIPGNPLPKSTQILAAYVGATDLPGQPDTPHIWSIDEWNLYLNPDSSLYGGPDLRCLPIFVHDFTGDAVTIAQNAIDAVTDLGWKSHLGRIIAFDTETMINRSFVHAVDLEVQRAGFRLMDYGSLDFVVHNMPCSGGLWGALLTATQPSILPPDCNGQQWRFGTEWDSDIFDEFVYENCGRGMRHSAV